MAASMPTSDTYLIQGGIEGRERLRVLSRVMWPTTRSFLDSLQLAPNARCLDVGCGGGDVTIALSRMVPDGSVTGIDFDANTVRIAQDEAKRLGVKNVEFRIEDVTVDPPMEERFDLIYARFVLTHLRRPDLALQRFHSQLKPGGVLAVEDIDFSGHVCFPPCEAFDRYVELYSQSARSRGCDPCIGPRLANLVRSAGFSDIQVGIVQPSGLSGEVKLMASLTLEAISDSIVKAGLETPESLRETAMSLHAFAAQEGNFMSVPRIFQCHGKPVNELT